MPRKCHITTCEKAACVCICVCFYQSNQCDLISSVYCGVCDMPLQAYGPVAELIPNPLR